MPFRHTPHEERTTLPDGTYEATILAAKEKQSAKGNNMIELALRVYDPEGGNILVNDYLVDSEASAFKIRHFCASAGIDYDAGEIDTEMLPDMSVHVKLGTEAAKGDFPARNKVKDYVSKDEIAERSASEPGARRNGNGGELADDSVPF